jgi:hypothetical protein
MNVAACVNLGRSGTGGSVTKCLNLAIALAAFCVVLPLGGASIAQGDVKPASMQFEWRTEGPASQCGRSCRAWVSAVGLVTDRTARDFEIFANDNAIRGATLVLDSEGGSVLGAMALGRAIRRLDITTTVGKTIVASDAASKEMRSSLSPRARCESMCAFILLGGARRHVPVEARVLVHQIWLGSKSKRALESSYSAEEISRVQRDVGSLARYTIEMGGAIELIEAALRVPPWEPMHELSGEEIRRMRLTTVDRIFDDQIATGSVTTGQSIQSTTVLAPSPLRARRAGN